MITVRYRTQPFIRIIGGFGHDSDGARLFLLCSDCSKCPASEICMYSCCGYHVFVDYLPDVWYDMPCSEGCARSITPYQLSNFVLKK